MPNQRLRRRVLALFAFLIAIVAPVATAQAAQTDTYIDLPQHKYPAFYVPPSPLPPGQPGEIIRWREMGFNKSLTKPPQGTKGYLVMYHSRSALGQDIAVVGYVLVPVAYNLPPGMTQRPIIGYGNEAMGLGDNCAQSAVLQYGNSGEVALYTLMLKKGYAIAATDYEGLGTPQVHTFGVTMSAAHTTLDMIRAARNLEAAQLPKNGPVGLLGYSQGGGAVTGAEEQQPTYAPDVKLTAVAAGGAPTNPLMFAKWNDGKIFSAVELAASMGYDAAYPELDLYNGFMNDRGKIAYQHGLNGCIEMVFSLPNRKIADYLQPGKNPLTDPRWLARFKENTIGLLPPKIPTYYFHGMFDQAVPYKGALELRKRWCAGGTPLHFQTIIDEHVSAAPLWMPNAEKWLDARMRGRPDKGNCGKLVA
ncbi:MAG: lipase family protein [Solirubrobacteraceae bacterium]|nr:lipase family protein [Patulibacter sp.]